MQGKSHGAAASAAVLPDTIPLAPALAGGEPRVIAIIGGGFSGTCLAIQLLRRGLPPGTRLLIFEPRAELGAGLAYATRDYPYPLNVAAAQMSFDVSQPHDFLDFARQQGIHAAAGDYLPRQVYGDYLRARFSSTCAANGLTPHAIHCRARVLQARRGPDSRWALWLEDGRSQAADTVILALGNPPPATLDQFASIAASGHYIHDPWTIGQRGHEDMSSVLLVGSGLTMIDAALRLAAIRPRVRHVHVLSRHGFLPQAQATTIRPLQRPDLFELHQARGSVLQLTRALRTMAGEISAAGGDWREAIAAIRPWIPHLWRELDPLRRAQFLRHLRAYWEAHRHRVPAGPLAAVRALERLGVLAVHAGRLEELRIVDDAVEVQWRPRGACRNRAWLVDRVVNCTGPDHRVAHHPEPLVRSLLANGLIRADALSLGIDVAQDGRVISGTGSPTEGLYYLGPWLRARDWEATAVPELREHAAGLAQHLIDLERTVRARRKT